MKRGIVVLFIIILISIFSVPFAFSVVQIQYKLNVSDDGYLNFLIAEDYGFNGFFKYPTSIPEGALITEAYFVFNVSSVLNLISGYPNTTWFYNCSSSWDEGSTNTTMYNLPCTYIDYKNISSAGVYAFNVTKQFIDAYNNNQANFSIAMNITYVRPAGLGSLIFIVDEPVVAVGRQWGVMIGIDSKESTGLISYLNITYTDNNKPIIIPILPTPENGTWYNSRTLHINATAWDTTSNVTECKITIGTSIPPVDSYTMTKTPNNGGARNMTCNYTFTNLADSSYYYRIIANDTGQNKNTTELREFYLDATYPLISYVNDSFSDLASYSKNYIIVNVSITETNFANFTFILANSTAEINRTFVTTKTSTRLNFTNLPNDVYKFNVTITDNASSKNFTLTRTVILDTILPVIEFITPTPANASNLSINSMTINTTITDMNNRTVFLNWQTSNYTMTCFSTATTGQINCNYSFVSLAEGRYTYNVFVNDSAGNANQTSLMELNIDTIAPYVSFISPANTSYDVNNITVNISADGIYTWWNNGSDTNLTYTSSFTLNLSDGQYTFTAYSNDSSNNINMTSVTFAIAYGTDVILPGINFSTPTKDNNTYWTKGYIVINVTVNDDTAVANLTFTLANSSGEINRTVTNANTLTFLNFTLLADGTYFYNVSINDTTGNMNHTETRTITLDNLQSFIGFGEQTFSNDSYNSKTYILINLSSIETNFANLTFILANSSGEINRTFSDATSETFSQLLNFTSLSDGIYVFNGTATDLAGNKNFTLTRTLILDTTSPSASISVPSSATEFGSSVTITCTRADAFYVNNTVIVITKPSSTTITKTDWNTTTNGNVVLVLASGSDKELNQLGTYKVDCTVKDYSGNSYSATQQTFSITSVDGGNGDSGGGADGGAGGDSGGGSGGTGTEEGTAEEGRGKETEIEPEEGKEPPLRQPGELIGEIGNFFTKIQKLDKRIWASIGFLALILILLLLIKLVFGKKKPSMIKPYKEKQHKHKHAKKRHLR